MVFHLSQAQTTPCCLFLSNKGGETHSHLHSRAYPFVKTTWRTFGWERQWGYGGTDSQTKTDFDDKMKSSSSMSCSWNKLPESICKQNKQHESPPLSLMQASSLLLLVNRKSGWRPSAHRSPDSVNKNIHVKHCLVFKIIIYYKVEPDSNLINLFHHLTALQILCLFMSYMTETHLVS